MRVFNYAFTATTVLILAGCSTAALNPNYQQTTKYKGSNPNGNEVVVQQAGYETQAPAPVTYAQQGASTGYAQPQTRSANYLECISKESNRKIIGTTAGGVVGAIAGRKIAGDNKTLGTVAGAAIGGAAGFGIADKTITCDREPVVVRRSAPINQPAPQAVTYHAPASTSGVQENTTSAGENGTPGYYAVNGIAPPVAAPQQVKPQLAQIQPIHPQQIQPETKQLQGPKTYTVPVSAIVIQHKVKPGDTLYSLAKTTCSSVAEIQNLNTINAEFYIRAGDDILLPRGRCTE